MSELQRCPFCGSANVYVSAWGLKKTAACSQCGARGPERSTAADAIRFWNARGETLSKNLKLPRHLRPLISVGDKTV